MDEYIDVVSSQLVNLNATDSNHVVNVTNGPTRVITIHTAGGVAIQARGNNGSKARVKVTVPMNARWITTRDRHSLLRHWLDRFHGEDPTRRKCQLTWTPTLGLEVPIEPCTTSRHYRPCATCRAFPLRRWIQGTRIMMASCLVFLLLLYQNRPSRHRRPMRCLRPYLP